MRKRLSVAAIAAAFAYGASAVANDTLVRFDTGFGVHPLIAGAQPNLARGVTPGGIPWAIDRLRARVKQDGSINVRGEGLVLAGGNAIGTRGGVLQVAAQVFCGNVVSTSPAANLSLGGNFAIRGRLTPPPPAGPCTNPALLIRNATGNVLGSWFAGGTVSDSDDD